MNETTRLIMQQLNTTKLVQGPIGPAGPQGPKGDKGDGTGGSGILVYSTLSALQTALPNGSTTPVWVTADNSWYYWTGAVTVTIPATPATPTVTAGNAQVALTWAAVSGATGYKVYRGGTLIASLTTNSYTDTSLTNGTAYSYTVSATNTAGESAQSAAASVTPTATVTIPATPATPTATAGNSKVDLGWTVVSGATSYKVYRGGTLLASPTTNSHSDTTAVNGTSYSYTVSAVNSAGESAQSSSASATPVAPTVTGVTANFNGADNPTSLGVATTGQTWTAYSGTWGIIGNQAYTSANGGVTHPLAAIESNLADCTVQATFVVNSSFNRVAFRVVDDANYLIAMAAPVGGKYQLFKKVANVFTQIGPDSTIVTANNDVVKAVLSGSSVTIYVNDVVAIATQTVTNFQTATKHGLGHGIENNNTARFDGFSAT